MFLGMMVTSEDETQIEQVAPNVQQSNENGHFFKGHAILVLGFWLLEEIVM